MRGEIGQIPHAVETLLDAVGREAKPVVSAFHRRRPAWLAIVARGTSDHAAVYARYLVETSLGIPAGLAAPSVTTIYRAPLSWRAGALLAISQSGQSPDVVEVTAAARAGGALTIAITNQAGSPLAGAAEHVVLCHAGDEEAVPATKTYVTQLVAVAALVGAIGDGGLGRDLPGLPGVLARTLDASLEWLASQGPEDSVASAIAASGRALVVSRGFNLATALEVALKLKETAGIFAEPYSAADLLHGPLILAARDVPTVVVRPDGPIAESIDAAADAARDRGARTWTISGDGDRAGRLLPLAGGLAEALTPIPYVIPGYLIAEEVAQLRGLDPDAPVGLSKVTQTR